MASQAPNDRMTSRLTPGEPLRNQSILLTFQQITFLGGGKLVGLIKDEGNKATLIREDE